MRRNAKTIITWTVAGLFLPAAAMTQPAAASPIILNATAPVSPVDPDTGQQGVGIAPQALIAVPPQTAPAPSTEAAAPAPYTAQQLEKMVGPIALYPDPLLAQVLAASTYPLEIVQAARFLKNNANDAAMLEKLDAQPFDASIKALARYPSVLNMLDENLQWTQDLGAAFLQQQADVMTAIQTCRAQAQAVGNLATTKEQVVTVNERIIQIVPADPQIIYVPHYVPEVIYVERPIYPVITFGIGYHVGSWLDLDCDWHHHHVYRGGWYSHHNRRSVELHVHRDVHHHRDAKPDRYESDRDRNIWQRDASKPASVVRAGRDSTRSDRSAYVTPVPSSSRRADSDDRNWAAPAQRLADPQPRDANGDTRRNVYRPGAGSADAPAGHVRSIPGATRTFPSDRPATASVPGAGSPQAPVVSNRDERNPSDGIRTPRDRDDQFIDRQRPASSPATGDRIRDNRFGNGEAKPVPTASAPAPAPSVAVPVAPAKPGERVAASPPISAPALPRMTPRSPAPNPLTLSAPQPPAAPASPVRIAAPVRTEAPAARTAPTVSPSPAVASPPANRTNFTPMNPTSATDRFAPHRVSEVGPQPVAPAPVRVAPSPTPARVTPSPAPIAPSPAPARVAPSPAPARVAPSLAPVRVATPLPPAPARAPVASPPNRATERASQPSPRPQPNGDRGAGRDSRRR